MGIVGIDIVVMSDEYSKRVVTQLRNLAELVENGYAVPVDFDVKRDEDVLFTQDGVEEVMHGFDVTIEFENTPKTKDNGGDE